MSVDAGYHESFFDLGVSEFEDLAPISPTESSKIIEVDAFERPTNVGRNAAVVIPQPQALGYVEPSLVDGVQKVSGIATASLDVEFLIPDENNDDNFTYEFTFSDDGRYQAIDSVLLDNGITAGFTLRRIGADGGVDTLAVSRAGASPDELFTDKVLVANTYDGMRFSILNPSRPTPVTNAWLTNNDADREAPRPRTSVEVSAPGNNTAVPIDYEIRVAELGADTSNSLSPGSRIPVNFQLWDVTNPNAARRVPLQITEGSAPSIPADTIAGYLSPGDVVNARVGGVDFQGYTFYSSSTWRFSLALSARGQNLMQGASLEAGILYDSLAAFDIRGFGSRPFGPDLSTEELDDFFLSIEPWFDDTRDSLLQIPGWRRSWPRPARRKHISICSIRSIATRWRNRAMSFISKRASP